MFSPHLFSPEQSQSRLRDLVELACGGSGCGRLIGGVFVLSPSEDDVFLLLLLRQVGALTNCVIELDLNHFMN